MSDTNRPAVRPTAVRPTAVRPTAADPSGTARPSRGRRAVVWLAAASVTLGPVASLAEVAGPVTPSVAVAATAATAATDPAVVGPVVTDAPQAGAALQPVRLPPLPRPADPSAQVPGFGRPAGPDSPADPSAVAAPDAPDVDDSATDTLSDPNAAGASEIPTDAGLPAPIPAPIPVEPAGGASTGRSVRADDVDYDDATNAVELHVNDADLVEVLRLLSLQSRRNIVATRAVKGTVTANLYGVTVREALDAILHANGYGYRERGNFVYVYTVQELQQLRDAERVVDTRVFRLFYTNTANAAVLIRPALSPAGQVALSEPALGGLAAGGASTGGDSYAEQDLLVVTDFPENLDRVAALLREVDRRPQQILVEATILRATLSEDNALGIDFNVVGGVDFSTLSSTSNGQIVGASAGTNITPSANSVGTGNSFSSPVAGGLKVGVVGSNVSVFVAALEGITDTTILANPKVLALNKQQGEVFVGRDDGYVTTTVSDTTATQTVEFLKTGTRLIFRPYVADDGFIRMEVHPEDSDGGLSSANLPFKVTTEVTSNVMVKDGRTVVIGGLFRDVSSTTKSQVPVLGNLPIAGALFRNQRDRTTREEVIILLTPHIVKDEASYAALSEQELQSAERLRVGVRRGMMPWGRERLAEGFYEQARRELDGPVPDRRSALFFLGAANNLNPTFTEAIELRRELTGREVTTSDNSSIRSFVRRSMLAEMAANGGEAPPARTPPREAVISVPVAAREDGPAVP